MAHNSVAICKDFSFAPLRDTAYGLVGNTQLRRPFVDSMVPYAESLRTAIQVDDKFQEFHCVHRLASVVVVQYFECFDCLDPAVRWVNRNVV